MYTTVPYIITVYYSLRVRHSNRLSVSPQTKHSVLGYKTEVQMYTLVFVRQGICLKVHQQEASAQRATHGAIGQHAESQLCSCGRQAQDCSVNSGSHFDLRLLHLSH